MTGSKTGRARRPRTTKRFTSASNSSNSQKEIIVNVSNRETRIALLEEGRLMEYRVERDERVVGSIFKGIVQNVLPGMDAAFVDIGLERNAFIHVGDIVPEDLSDSSPASMRRSELRRRKIKDLLKSGQQLMVQVTKGPRGTKGARVTSRIALPGRFVVLMPESSNVGVSRKIEERSERDRLRRIGDKIVPAGFGLILRTECEGRTEAELLADILYLQSLWDDILKTAKKVRAPAIVHRDQSLLFRTIRDMFSEGIHRMVIDDPDEYEKVHMVAARVGPEMRTRIELYDSGVPIFDTFGIERELERFMQHKVPLKSGGYLVIDEMEALTAIDVNTGKHVGTTSLSDTILRSNLEAADEILRQLRLRDMGGIIVCDFIDMEDESGRKKLLEHFKSGLLRDHARTRVGRISSLGLIELTRKRTGESVTQAITEECPMCLGVGRISSKESVSFWIERAMSRSISEPGNAFCVECHPSVVEALIGSDGENVEELEHELKRGIYVRANFDMEYDEYDVRYGTIDDFDKELMNVRRAQVVEVNVRRSAYASVGKVVGWTDAGYYVELMGGEDQIGSRTKVCLQDIRRSYAVGEVLFQGAPVVSRA